MKFNMNSSEWIAEVKSYLKDASKKTSEVKKVLKAVDFSKLSYEDKFRLSTLFDPTAEITEEAFKRQLDLYFSLLESKSSPMTIPIFSEYIEWVYSQDPSKIPDEMFALMISKLAKSNATQIPESVASFMNNLTKEFDRDIDKMSKTRLDTLIAVLKDMNLDYIDQPVEVQNFIKRMFIACAVKTEIADKNTGEIIRLFKDDPKKYYDSFNKAFAGVDFYSQWIEEPAKKLTTQNMINYANFQEAILGQVRGNLLSKKDLNYLKFQTIARTMKLPILTEYDKNNPDNRHYLSEPRKYKSYAEKLAGIFSQMMKAEAVAVAKKAKTGEFNPEDLNQFAPTQRMQKKLAVVTGKKSPTDIGIMFAQYLIGLIHLNDLTKRSTYNLFNINDLRELSQNEEGPVQLTFGQFPKTREEAPSKTETVNVQKQAEKKAVKEPKEDGYIKGLRRELNELYERYHELMQNDQRDLSLEDRIFEIESRIAEMSDTENSKDESQPE